MDARLTGALVFCGAGIAMTLAVVTLLRRSGRQLLAGIGEDAPDRPSTTGRFAHTRTDTGIAMRGLSNLLAGCLCLATAGFVLRDVSVLWDPATGVPDADRVVHQQSGTLGWYVLVFGLLYLCSVLILLAFRSHLRRAAAVAPAALSAPSAPQWAPATPFPGGRPGPAAFATAPTPDPGPHPATMAG